MTLFISNTLYAKNTHPSITPLNYNQKHVDLFNHRNFCVVCTFNDALLSPETLYSGHHVNTNISASYVYHTVMDKLDLTFGFLYAIKGEYFTIKNSIVKMLNITYSDLPYLTFTGNSGELVNFTGTGLTSGNFRQAELISPIFEDTALWYTDFTDVKFENANFKNTLIVEAKFIDAQLINADFSQATIQAADFSNANLLNAIISKEQLNNSIVCGTTLPDGQIGAC